MQQRVVRSYRARRLKCGSSPNYFLFGKEFRTTVLGVIDGKDEPEDDWLRIIKMAVLEARRAERVVTEGQDEVRGTTYEVGDCLLMRSSQAARALEPKWLGPYNVIGATHPTYTLRREGGRRSTRSTHTAQLTRYIERVDAETVGF